MVSTYHTGHISDEKLCQLVRQRFDLTPRGIIRALKLRRPIYRQTACYGHFGRNEDGFTWEEIDRVEELKKAAKGL